VIWQAHIIVSAIKAKIPVSSAILRFPLLTLPLLLPIPSYKPGKNRNEKKQYILRTCLKVRMKHTLFSKYLLILPYNVLIRNKAKGLNF